MKNLTFKSLNDGFELQDPIYKLDKDTVKKYRANWKIESNQLQTIIQNAVASCFRKKLLTQNQYDEYFLSSKLI